MQSSTTSAPPCSSPHPITPPSSSPLLTLNAHALGIKLNRPSTKAPRYLPLDLHLHSSMATFLNPSPLIQPPSPSFRPGCLRSGHVNAPRFMPLVPLFGRSPNPSGPTGDGATVDAAIEARPESINQSAGCFTEEKAKQLRRKTVDCYTFHDAMYHSAIASRLASDVSRPF